MKRHAAPAVHASPDAGPSSKEAHERKRRRRHGATRVARADGPGDGAGSAGENEPEPVKLSPSDLKLVSQGDDLSRPDVIHLGDATDDSGSRELGQDDIDLRFRAKEEAILDCISHARPDEETYVPGRVTVKFRIQRTGNVRGVRVEAPAILQKGGLTGCVRGVVGGLRFPPSNGSQVVSYPFSLT
ncbi:MAG TPA: AgmX/PglI C-terminal domain-containing protein [Polyangia bacterium]|nr:AgmX/PglI C-terminal domain-containing protein [Polyangia bacterium]